MSHIRVYLPVSDCFKKVQLFVQGLVFKWYNSMPQEKVKLLVTSIMDYGSGVLVSVTVGSFIDGNVASHKALMGIMLSLALWYTGLSLINPEKSQ